jgi:hypothetical protein
MYFEIFTFLKLFISFKILLITNIVKVNLTPFLKKKFSIQIILALEFLFMKNK